MDHAEGGNTARGHEIWRSMAALERDPIGGVGDGYASVHLREPDGHQERRRHHTSSPSSHQSSPSHPANTNTGDSIPDEPPPSYEDSQAQAEAEGPGRSLQNLALRSSPAQPQPFSSNQSNAANLRHTTRSPGLRPHISGPLPNPGQPTSALLEYALRFQDLASIDKSSSTTSRLPRPILIPSAPTTPHSFPTFLPLTIPNLSESIFKIFLGNLNILLSLSAADPFPTTTVSEPLVHAYLSRLNSALFHPRHLHISLVPTQDLAATLLERDPLSIETSRVLDAQAAVLSHQPVKSLESWVHVVDPSIVDPLIASTLGDKKSSPDEIEMLRLRDQVISERKAARHLAVKFLGSDAAESSSRHALPPGGGGVNTWTEWNSGDRAVDHVLKAEPKSSKSKSKSPLSDGDDAASVSSSSSSPSSSSSSSSSSLGRTSPSQDKRSRKQARRSAKSIRRQEKRTRKRERREERRVRRAERKAERDLRRGKGKGKGKEKQQTMTERTKGRTKWWETGGEKDRGVTAERERKEVLWLVVHNKESDLM